MGNLVVVAVSSNNRISKCWDVKRDVEHVARVLKDFSNRFSPTRSSINGTNNRTINTAVPIYAFGASSGGSFVSGLAAALLLQSEYQIRLNGFISQISASSVFIDDIDANSSSLCEVYITMNRDVHTDIAAKKIVSNCVTDNSTSQRRHSCKHIRLPSLPISNSYFSNRIPEISSEESNAMFEALHKKGYIDSVTYELNKDPRRSNWREVIFSNLPHHQHDSLRADESPISEVMNVAYGKHEMTKDGVREALEFCMNVL